MTYENRTEQNRNFILDLSIQAHRHMRRYTKNIQGGSQLRDISKSKRFAQVRGNVLYINVPNVKVMSSLSG